MPIDPAIEELILKEIDGPASAQESARLREILANDKNVRDELASQKEVAALLSRVQPLEAPPDLRRLVMASLPAVPPARGTASPPQHGPGGRVLPYLYAAAAGLVVGLVLGPRLTPRLAGLAPADPTSVVGALAPADRATRMLLDETDPGSIGGGVARLYRVDGGLLVEVSGLAEGTPAVLQFDPDALSVSGFSPEPGGADLLAMTPGEIRWRQTGPLPVAIEMRRLTIEGTQIHVRPLSPAGEDPVGEALVVPPG